VSSVNEGIKAIFLVRELIAFLNLVLKKRVVVFRPKFRLAESIKAERGRVRKIRDIQASFGCEIGILKGILGWLGSDTSTYLGHSS